jgi:hypothetical protein
VDYSGEPWVQRLRDGESPRTWRVALGLSLVFVASALILVEEVTHASFVRGLVQRPREFSVVLLPLLVAGLAVYLAISSWFRAGQDRRTLARIRARSHPEFFLPVAPRRRDPAPSRDAVIWAIDSSGFTAWNASSPGPVATIAWTDVTGIEPLQKSSGGQQWANGLALQTDQGGVVLRCRVALRRSFTAGQTKQDILYRVLLSLRPATARPSS